MKITNKFHLPPVIAAALKTNWYDKHDSISATSLINPPRIYYLRRRHADEITEDVSDRIWTLFGSSIHEVLQNTAMPDTLKEERLFLDIAGKTISGKFDVFDGDILTDYKVTSAWTIVFGSRKKEWEQQLNIYAYLLHNAGFSCNKLQIIALLRDWQKSKALQDSNYPQLPISVINLPLWDVEKQQEFITNRVMRFTAAEKKPDNELPLCTDEERWMSETVYAVKKPNRKSAIKLYKTLEEAEKRAKTEKGGYVETRKGEPKRCKDYCPVKDFCNQYKEEK